MGGSLRWRISLRDCHAVRGWGACRCEGAVVGEHVPDRLRESAGEVDLGDLGAALLAEPISAAIVLGEQPGDAGDRGQKRHVGVGGAQPAQLALAGLDLALELLEARSGRRRDHATTPRTIFGTPLRPSRFVPASPPSTSRVTWAPV